jgi:hypothetical protein
VSVTTSVWIAEPIAPIPLLAELRDFVLVRSTTRLPKWRFRLADDLVVQMQPKPSGCLFTCRALQGDNITSGSFQSLSAARGLPFVDFTILDINAIRSGPAPARVLEILGISGDADGWALKPFRAAGHALRDRILHELRAGHFDALTPVMMLSPACLACGKALTDPVSIARWIGPECFGSSSLSVPQTLNLTALGGAA